MKIETKIKLIFWHLVLLTLSFWFWMYIDYVLNVLTPDSWRFDFEPSALINFVLLVTLTALGSMIFNHWQWTISFYAINAVMFIAFFGVTVLNLAGVALAALMNLDSFRVISEELRERAKLNPGIALGRGLTRVIISVFLLISFAAYQSPVVQSIENMDRIPSAGVVLVRNVVDVTIGSQPEVRESGDKEFIVGQVTQQTVGRLNSLFSPYFRYAPPFLAFTLFLVLWGASWVFTLTSMLLGQGMFLMLKKVGFFKVQEYDIKAEKLSV